LLHELVPKATVAALLVNPTNPVNDPETRSAQDAARTLGMQVRVLRASTPIEIDAAFGALVELRAGLLVVSGDPVLTDRRDQIVALAAGHAVPAIYLWREFAAAGGLMSYGISVKDAYRQIGVYAGRILKGEKPADLPVQQITKVELIINLKIARALGLTVSLPLLGRADEVIE
jgi:putative tryptophan/tyrosine transport system substrate-binding protein